MPSSKRKLDRELVRQVAVHLSKPAACHPEFMFEVAMVMQTLGFDIECHQKGIKGTYVRVVACPLKKEQDEDASSSD